MKYIERVPREHYCVKERVGAIKGIERVPMEHCCPKERLKQ
jgi:hypothetical protein